MSKPKSGTIKRRNEHGPIGCAQERMFEDSIVANPLRHYETGNQAFSMCLRFLTIRVSDLRQRGLVSSRKEQSALDLGFQDTVLRSQIFVPQQQFLNRISISFVEASKPTVRVAEHSRRQAQSNHRPASLTTGGLKTGSSPLPQRVKVQWFFLT